MTTVYSQLKDSVMISQYFCIEKFASDTVKLYSYDQLFINSFLFFVPIIGKIKQTLK